MMGHRRLSAAGSCAELSAQDGRRPRSDAVDRALSLRTIPAPAEGDPCVGPCAPPSAGDPTLGRRWGIKSCDDTESPV